MRQISEQILKELGKCKDLGELLRLAESMEAYDGTLQCLFNLGINLRWKKYFSHAKMVVDKGLNAESEEKLAEKRLHCEFHFAMSDLGFDIRNNGFNPIDYGFPVSKIPFEFSEEKGFYLPKALDKGGICNGSLDYQDVGMEIAREIAFFLLLYELGKTEHTRKECLYFKLLQE